MSEKTQAVSRVESLSISQKIEQVLMKGDLSSLTEAERVSYYNKVCDSVGLNPLTQPFSYIVLNGKLVLYANKSCADQLRSIHKISITIVSREKIGDVYVVTASAKNPENRVDESTGAVSVGKATGDVLANLYMKAETKAKRRVTLSIVGLGLLDESEIETIVPTVVADQKPIDKPPIAPPKPRETNPEATNHLVPEATLDRLYAKASELGWGDDEVKAMLKERFNISNPKEVLKIHYNAISKAIEDGE